VGGGGVTTRHGAYRCSTSPQPEKSFVINGGDADKKAGAIVDRKREAPRLTPKRKKTVTLPKEGGEKIRVRNLS